MIKYELEEKRMAHAEIEKQKVQEITEKLEQGLQELFESKKYKSYLNTMSKFHNYSYNNTMLIAMQKPDATLIAGYNAWQNSFERHVKKGEKGIRILAPAAYKIKEEQDEINPDTHELVLDEQGKPKKEVVEYTIPAFKVVPVFDLSQTEGKELPGLGAQELIFNVEGYQDFMQALTEVSPVPIGFEDIPGDSKGYFHFKEKRIAIQEGMSDSQTIKTGVHEVSHAKLHNREINKSVDLQSEDFKDKNTKEVEAESIAYTVCQHFGIDTSDYSFGYIAGWSSGKDMKELKSSLDTIRKTASELITQIEVRMQELQRDRQKEKERANEIIMANDVIVKISASMGIEYEVNRITNKSLHEVQAILKDYAEHGEAESGIGIFIQEKLESKGAELIPIMASNGFNDGFPEFYDFNYDYDTNEVISSSELSIMKQAENYMNRMEFKNPVLSDEERNLIVNYAYKLDDIVKTRLLIEQLVYQEEYAKHDVGLTVINAQAEIDFLPDGMVGLSEMHEYGYSWDGMLPLTKDRAIELNALNLPIYQLHVDESESFIEDEIGLMEHDGLFGIESGNWQQYLELREQMQDLKEYSASKEMQLIQGNEDRFEIYQLKDTEETRGYHFMSMDYLEMKGITVERENYELVYTAPLGGMGLEDIYTKFNIDRPEDFTGHSLSVSDVVVLHQNGKNSSNYVDSIGYQEVPDFMKEHMAEKEKEAPKVSYYVIEDLATWKENSEKRSVLERFDNIYNAMAKFSQYKSKTGEYPNDDARTTLGVSIGGIEFDILHVREAENYLVHDFAQIKVAQENSQLLDDLQIVHDVIGFDKIRIHREMTPEEVKDFVKQRCEYQLKNSGIEDISVYMERFDLLYEHRKMEHLMPTVNQRQVTDVLAVSEWENSYLEQREPEQLAYSIAGRYVSIQICTDGYDYSIFDEQYKLLDGGVYDNPDISIKEALHEVIVDLKEPKSMGGRNDVVKGNVKPDDVLLPVDYEMLMEMTEEADRIVDNRENSEVAKFRARTEELFHEIGGENEKTQVTLMVAECGEFHNLGEFYEGINSVDEAIAIFNQFPPERMNGIRSIGINIHEEGTADYEDVVLDILWGNTIDLEILEYVPDITGNPKAMEVIAEIVEKVPSAEVLGSLEKWKQVEQSKIDQQTDINETTMLAIEIDQFCYNYDTYEYRDSIDDREEQVKEITEDIATGDVEHIQAFLQEVIAENHVEENVHRAKELIQKLSEYKPLAKIEELEEANYNMIDNVINNEKPKKEQDCSSVRSSIKEKLAEKKVAIVQREKTEKSVPEKEAEKKSEREI